MKPFVLLFLLIPVNSVTAGKSWSSFQNGGHVSVPSAQTMQLGDIQWQVDLRGYGQSSPVVWDQHVYVTTVEGDNKEECHVTSYRLNDGKQVWQHTVVNATPAENSNYISRAAPSPTVDADGVVCLFEGGNVVALTHDGDLRWERNLVSDYGEVKSRHGLSSSLEQNDGSVFVWIERSEDPYVLSLNKQNGETEWKSNGLGATSWASPRLVPVGAGRHLVLSAVGSIAGLDPATGKHLWLLTDVSGNSTPTPMPLNDGRFLIGATVGRGEAGGGRAAESNGVVQIKQGTDGSWSADFAWKAKRATSSFGSPVVHKGTAFFVNREGVLYGLNAKDGQELFAKRLKASVWATPIGIGDQIFFFEKDGMVESLAEIDSSQSLTVWNKLPVPPTIEKPTAETEGEGGPPSSDGPILYAAVVATDAVLLRCGDVLSCVSLEATAN